MKYLEGNLSRRYLGVFKRKDAVIPVVTHKDFVNTSTFEGNDIRTYNPDENQGYDSKIVGKMEEYAKTVLYLFIPHRCLDQLMGNHSTYLLRFQAALRDKELSERHLQILQNVQDVHNSDKAGKPRDPVINGTHIYFDPNLEEEKLKEMEEKEDNNEAIEKMFDILNSTESDVNNSLLQPERFRDDDNNFTMRSAIIRDHGTHGSGYRFIRTPDIDETNQNSTISCYDDKNLDDYHLLGEETDDREPILDNPYRRITNEGLKNTLLFTSTERVINDEGESTLPATGEYENILEWADEVAGEDIYQKNAFVLFTAAFVLELYKIADDNDEYNMYQYVDPDNVDMEEYQTNGYESENEAIPQLLEENENGKRQRKQTPTPSRRKKRKAQDNRKKLESLFTPAQLECDSGLHDT